MGEANGILGHALVGCAVLLSDFPISLSTESTGLSSHPVHNINLKGGGKQAVKGLVLFFFLPGETFESVSHVKLLNCFQIPLHYLQCIQIHEDLLKTVGGSVQSDARTLLSDLNLA